MGRARAACGALGLMADAPAIQYVPVLGGG